MSGPHKLRDNREGTTVQNMVNSDFGMEKLLCTRRDVERYSELITKSICARSELSFLFRTCIGRMKKTTWQSQELNRKGSLKEVS